MTQKLILTVRGFNIHDGQISNMWSKFGNSFFQKKTIPVICQLCELGYIQKVNGLLENSSGYSTHESHSLKYSETVWLVLQSVDRAEASLLYMVVLASCLRPSVRDFTRGVKDECSISQILCSQVCVCGNKKIKTFASKNAHSNLLSQLLSRQAPS